MKQTSVHVSTGKNVFTFFDVRGDKNMMSIVVKNYV